MRKVRVAAYIKRDVKALVNERECEAWFRRFGCDFVEFESGAGNYTTAIIEWPDGTIESVPVESIRFVS